jgi:putative addiction module component (TIGR02574 family)
MIAQTEIRKMPLSEKLELLEAVWAELATDPDTIDVPQWHKDILHERQLAIDQGSMQSIDWEVAKEQINRRVR